MTTETSSGSRTVFRLDLFGGPTLKSEDSPLGLSPLEGSLLGIVYGGEIEFVTREQVISLLWPEELPARSRRRLNQLLYSFKKKTGDPPPFAVEGEEIHRDRDKTGSDLQDFNHWVEYGDLYRARALLSLGFLKRVDGRLTRALSDWIVSRDAQLRADLRRRAQGLLVRSEQDGHWVKAREAAETLLALDPDDERILREVMKTAGSHGSVLDAESALKEFRTRIEKRTGRPWTPSEETSVLLERLQSNNPAPQGEIPGLVVPELQEPELVGREEEHRLLRRTLYSPPHHALRGILVSGEAGIGKTRLIKEALRGIGLEGQQVFWAGLSEFERLIPLTPLIEAFRAPSVGQVVQAMEEPWRTVLYGIMPHHFPGGGRIPQPPRIESGHVPRRLFEAIDQLLIRLVEQEPCILVIDDLQWADDTTLTILEFLIQRWDKGRFQVLLSVRSEEVRKETRLYGLLDTLRLHSDSVQIQLGDLNQDRSRELIRSLSEQPLQNEEISYLQSLSGGNPFFIIELTLEYLAGRLDKPVIPTTSLAIPLSIKQVLRRRLSQLEKTAERIISAICVHTRPIPLENLARVCRIDLNEILLALEQLQSFRLVRNQGTLVSPRHELIRQTVYQELNPTVKAWLHEQVAFLLQASEEEAPSDELALHFHKAGVSEAALRFALETAENAENSGAIAEAIQFYLIARDHASDPHQVAEIVGRMGHLYFLDHRLKEAAPLLEVGSKRSREQGSATSALKWELERIDCLRRTGLLPVRECLEELSEIEDEAISIDEWETFVRALDVKAHLFDQEGDLESLRSLLGKAGEHTDAPDPRARAKAHALLALNTYFGSPQEGLAAARIAVNIAEQTSDNDVILHCLNRLLITLIHQGLANTPEGQEVLARAVARSENSGDLILKFFVRLNKGVWHLETRSLDHAETTFESAQFLIRGSGMREPLVKLHLNFGELYLEKHDITRAKKYFQMASDHLDRTAPKFLRILISSGLGQCALHDGDLGHARSRESELPDFPHFWTFDPTVPARFKARMFLRRGDHGAALALLAKTREEVDGRFIPAWLRLSMEEIRIKKMLECRDVSVLANRALRLAEKLNLKRIIQDLRRLEAD